MPSIIKKYQNCGKENCHCKSSENVHGPYYWYVRYIKPRNSFKKGKYKWRFISKDPKDVEIFIHNNEELSSIYKTKESLESVLFSKNFNSG